MVMKYFLFIYKNYIATQLLYLMIPWNTVKTLKIFFIYEIVFCLPRISNGVWLTCTFDSLIFIIIGLL